MVLKSLHNNFEAHINFPKVGNAKKGQLTCYVCKKNCLAKNGDWHVSPNSGSQQFFVCTECERHPENTFKRAFPIK